VLRSSPWDEEGRSSRGAGFVLYVEGPSDCEILRSWARLVSPALSETVARSAVILGGRRPARAVEHFEGVSAERAGLRGLCVLDRDGHGPEDGGDAPEGLEFFTWPRRHIESYLLVPTAMRRCMRMPPGDPRVSEMLLDLPRDGSEGTLRDLDAKRLLAAKSTLARELGVPLSAARIARCMSRADLHPDVLELLDRVVAASPALGAGARARGRRRAGARR
jgi:hypothetical protein